MATLHDQNSTDYDPGPVGPTEPYRHASIAETQDPTIGTPVERGRPPNEMMLASDIPLRVFLDLLLEGAYDPAKRDERFAWMGAVTSAGAGVISIPVGPIPAGQDWMIEAITYTTITAAVQACTRLDSVNDPASIIDVAPVMVNVGGQFSARSVFNSPEFVPQGRQLYVQFNAAGADTFYTRIRYRLRQGEAIKAN
jgi:hypothetical protein